MKSFYAAIIFFCALTTKAQELTGDYLFLRTSKTLPFAVRWAFKSNEINDGDLQVGISQDNFLPDFKSNPSLAKFSITRNGYVGIGATSPMVYLHLLGRGEVEQRIEAIDIGKPSLSFRSNNRNWIWTKLPGTEKDAMRLSFSASESTDNIITILPDGNIGLGIDDPPFRLAVRGTVKCVDVKADVKPGSGPDYVFEASYNLPSLSSVESYIRQNKHLPEVPSAKEMEKNGVNLGEMEMLLLKKIEELTLYQIEQNRINLQQQELIEKLNDRICQLEKRIYEN